MPKHVEDADGLGRHLRPDSVPRQDGDVCARECAHAIPRADS